MCMCVSVIGRERNFTEGKVECMCVSGVHEPEGCMLCL